MKTNYLSFILLFLCSLILINTGSCKRTNGLNEDCYDFEKNQMLILYIQNGIQYENPEFNPQNSDEFVYIQNDLNGDYHLIKYNLNTHDNVVLYSGPQLFFQPKWSNKGVIAFVSSYCIYTIEDNGQNLKLITDNGANLYPEWNWNGDELYWQNSAQLGVPYWMLRFKTVNSKIDTVYNGGVNILDIGITNQLICEGSEFKLFTSNITNPLQLNDFENNSIDDYPYTFGLCWDYTGTGAFCTKDGLYHIEVPEGNITKIRNHCDSKRYESLSASSDGKKLICERVDSKQIMKDGNPTPEIVEQSNIYIIDLEDFFETKIDL